MSENQLKAKIRQLRKLQAQIDKAQNEAEAIKNEIKAHMGDTEELRVGEYKIFWQTVTSNRLDTKALKQAIPELVERFTSTVTTRRFCVN